MKLQKIIILFYMLSISSMAVAYAYDVPGKKILNLYQTMKDVHEILQRHKIPYWAHAGTLLGAVRHKGIIPWDDDLDIVVEKKYEEDFKKLKPVFESFGYKFKQVSFGYQILYNYSPHDMCGLDVMIFVNQDGKYKYDPISRHAEFFTAWEKIFFTHDDLFPLKEYKFGEMYIMGPNNPKPYLDLTYPKWSTHAVMYNHHTSPKIVCLNEIIITAAQPTGPLLDRIFQKNNLTRSEIEKVTLRMASVDDADAIAGLLAQLGFDQHSIEMCCKKINHFTSSASDKVWVAAMEDRVVGLLALNIITPFYHPKTFARIDTLVVDIEYRGYGIGKMLTDFAESYAKDLGCDRVFLTSGNHRLSSHDFYRHIGYVSNAQYFVKNFPGPRHLLIC